ncbi:MAG: SMC family ATPase [Anaerolineales bacterium]|nr:SMC family ATPase [Anaerolineales bacterium]
MIPLHLRIAGFLSYQDSVELSFETFDLACISGQNGAGKSSLLDAFTWALFGEARGKSAEVINLNPTVKAAEVALTFKYEDNIYRVQRTLPRGKSTVLEFQVLNQTLDEDQWRALTEKTTRDTQARIEQTLRLDYETFVNASFFLQGKADQFTQKKSSERKAVLSSILGLEIWDVYKERTVEKRKALEGEVNAIDGRLAEIEAELSEEGARKSRLSELEKNLKQIALARETQDALLANLKNTAAILHEQRKLAETLEKSLNNLRFGLSNVESKIAEKENEQKDFSDLIGRANEIEAQYKEWEKIQKELNQLENSASAFREHDEKRQPLLREIEVERGKLEQEMKGLKEQEAEIRNQELGIKDLETAIDSAKNFLAEAELKIEERESTESRKNAAREKLAGLKAENEALRKEMDDLKNRIDTLKETKSAECPLCGQPLSKAHREETLEQLEKDGKEKGDAFRANKKEFEELEKQITNYELQLATYKNLDNERVQFSNSLSTANSKLDTINSQAANWEKTGAKRLKEINKILESGKFAVDAQKELVKIDKELAKLGYDIALHESKRNEELALSGAGKNARLDKAKDLSKRIQKEITELEEDRRKKQTEVTEHEKDHQDALKKLAKSEANSPNLQEAEDKLFTLREDENQIRGELGGAEQKVKALETQRARKADYETQREELKQTINRHKNLERAFGKDGVPALLIEQALPQIEQKANDLLERLSDGKMSIRFVTQAKYKDEKREDLRETLEIQISDSSGARDYEMYSGGEAFRVNFAIRLALSEILAQRKGARLQTLVIDEGFGSQDAQGRQRLVEAINLVRHDFEKILVITHLDELKDAFPNRIEVEKTENGSSVKVV